MKMKLRPDQIWCTYTVHFQDILVFYLYTKYEWHTVYGKNKQLLLEKPVSMFSAVGI